MSRIITDLSEALAALRAHNVLAIPTETVYGLAADATNVTAVRSVYEIKKRPFNHPLIMHVAPEWDLSQWVSHIPSYVSELIAHFCPGPLTLVLPRRPDAVLDMVTGGHDTLAVRVPNHPLSLALLRAFGAPLVAPSANPFGKMSPTTPEHVLENFPQETFLILDGGRCTGGIESTIVDATETSVCRILRAGLLDSLAITQVIGPVLQESASLVPAPGCLEQHYQPNKPLYCFEDIRSLRDFAQQQEVAVLSFHASIGLAPYFYYQFSQDPVLVAHDLYYELHKADHSSATCIAVELPPNTPIWQGIRERLIKASQ
ncbi:MAG: L-threonylcarbamoyladenylate synthase [Legionellaceae bacterium]|nr:L-threonylcarbamoyladenylate synthase [Legionellaceae bacterium]